MSGIALVSGINSVGKGEVCRILARLIPNSRHLSLSGLMKDLGALDGHHSLGSMGIEERNILRRNALDLVRTASENHSVLLDSHFVFEDGERSDFSRIRSATAQIVLVGSSPQTIRSRLSYDPEINQRPARIALLGFTDQEITDYICADEREAKIFASLQNPTIPLVRIDNDFPSIPMLEDYLTQISPELLDNFHRPSNEGIEGPPRLLRR